MEPSYKYFFDFIRRIKNPFMEHNSYFLPSVLAEILENKNNFSAIGDQAAIFLQNDGQLFRLYYYAKDRESLKEIPGLLADKKELPIVCDVILEKEDETFLKSMKDAGFRFYTTFIHMHCDSWNIPVVSKYEDLSYVTYAKKDDAVTICEMIEKTFDVWSAHFPCIEEVAEAIEKKSIYVIRNGSALASFAWFDDLGVKKSLLRFIIVNPEYRGNGYGTGMVRKKIIESPEIKYYELWIEDSNLTGRAQHLKNGYVIDNKIDYIFKH